MGRPGRIASAAVVVFCLAAWPQDGETQIRSSLRAHCAQQSCQNVFFALTLDGSSTVNFQFNSIFGEVWQFESIEWIRSGVGRVDVTDDWTIFNSAMFVGASNAAGSPEPILMKIRMAQWVEDESQLYDGSLVYAGTAEDAEGVPYGFDGVVMSTVPEPSTVVLLMTGLVGLALITRRKMLGQGVS